MWWNVENETFARVASPKRHNRSKQLWKKKTKRIYKQKKNLLVYNENAESSKTLISYENADFDTKMLISTETTIFDPKKCRFSHEMCRFRHKSNTYRWRPKLRFDKRRSRACVINVKRCVGARTARNSLVATILATLILSMKRSIKSLQLRFSSGSHESEFDE